MSCNVHVFGKQHCTLKPRLHHRHCSRQISWTGNITTTMTHATGTLTRHRTRPREAWNKRIVHGARAPRQAPEFVNSDRNAKRSLRQAEYTQKWRCDKGRCRNRTFPTQRWCRMRSARGVTLPECCWGDIPFSSPLRVWSQVKEA